MFSSCIKENCSQTSRSILHWSLHHEGRLMGFPWAFANYARKPWLSSFLAGISSVKSNFVPRGYPVLDSMCSDRGSIWMSGIRVSLRRFHRRSNNSFHPFGNAYKPRDRIATEGGTGKVSREVKGTERNRGGFRPVFPGDERRGDDVENQLVYAYPPEKGLFFIQNNRSFNPGRFVEQSSVFLFLNLFFVSDRRCFTRGGKFPLSFVSTYVAYHFKLLNDLGH